MSETAGIGPTPRPTPATAHPTVTAKPTPKPTAKPTVTTSGTAASQNVTEAYSFACMNCGYGWEQAFEIEHHVDTTGRPYVTYLADGTKVPSPLTHPTCGNCDGHHVRIMTSGQVAGVAALRAARRPIARHAAPVVPRTHHRSLLRFLHRRHGHGQAQAQGHGSAPAAHEPEHGHEGEAGTTA